MAHWPPKSCPILMRLLSKQSLPSRSVSTVDRGERLARLSAQAKKLEREIGNLIVFIRDGDSSPHVREDLEQLEFVTNDYSVPAKYAHRKLIVVATVEEVRLVYEDRLVARHRRCWDRERTFFEPIHYPALLERKPGGFDHARPLENWQLPECFVLLRRLEAADPRYGTRSYIRVLWLLEKLSLSQLTEAVEYALDIDVYERDHCMLPGKSDRKSFDECRARAKIPQCVDNSDPQPRLIESHAPHDGMTSFRKCHPGAGT
jgi:hypothetical protein